MEMSNSKESDDTDQKTLLAVLQFLRKNKLSVGKLKENVFSPSRTKEICRIFQIYLL